MGHLLYENCTCMSFLPPANEVCEGYVFTRVCHSVHEGWCLLPEGGACSGGGCLLLPGGRRSSPREVPAPWGGRVPALVRGGVFCCMPPPDGYCCGRYASYWNAFFSHKIFTCMLLCFSSMTCLSPPMSLH